MFLIYSLNLENYEVKIIDTTPFKHSISTTLQQAVLNFIKSEQGERYVADAIKDNVPDEKITQDGYFIRSSKEKNHYYIVFKRNTVYTPGRFWGLNLTVNINPVLHFGVLESSLEQPLYGGEVHSGDTIKKPEFSTQYQTNLHDELMKELAVKIQEKKCKKD